MIVINCFPTTFSPAMQTCALLIAGAVLTGLACFAGTKLAKFFLTGSITKPSRYPLVHAIWLSCTGNGAAFGLGVCLYQVVALLLQHWMGQQYYDIEPLLYLTGLLADSAMMCFFLVYIYFLRLDILRHSAKLSVLLEQTNDQAVADPLSSQH